MNCNDAFDYLTDPQRRHADELKRHLDGCPRCRHMQATLEPALSLFGEPDGSWCGAAPEPFDFYSDVVPNESRPARVHPADLAFAQESAARLSRQNQIAERSRRTVRLATRYAAVFLAGALAASAVLSVPLKAQPCAWQQPDQIVDETAGPQAVVMACVDCHQSTNPDRIPAAAASMVLGCVACHQNNRGLSEAPPLRNSAPEIFHHSPSQTRFDPLECLWPHSRI